MITQNEILKKVVVALEESNQGLWLDKIRNINKSRIHIAVMVEPYLSYILEGKKTIESRFSKNRMSPFQKINKGDIIILKKSGGGYVAAFEAGEVRFFEPEDEKDIEEIRREYNDRLCIANDFWELKSDSRFVTLIDVTNLCVFKEFQMNEPNRKSWIDFTDDERNQVSIFDRPSIICIAGKAGSGKTTVAKILASQINSRYVTVSDYLKSKCDELNVTREVLQKIGNECISQGWANFVHAFLKFVGWNGQDSLIIDGIRHVSFMEMLIAEFYPVRPICVYLDADQETLDSHIAQRGVEVIDKKPVSEGTNEKLVDCADIVIPVKDLNANQIAEKIIAYVRTYDVRTDDSNTDINSLRQYIDGFNSRRGWKNYHNSRDLAMSISIEAAELLEIFQWNNKGGKERIQEELGDVLIYCIDMANSLGIDITDIILKKIRINSKKYPEK